MLVAFAIVAWAARTEYLRSGSAAGVFSDVYLDRTLKRVDQRSAAIVDDLVRFGGITRDEATSLERAAQEIHELDELFSPYVSPQFAQRLCADPNLAALGGVEREVSVLFADLQGFTAFSESRPPVEVITMLNRYWSAAVPVVGREGGDIERFAGDAIFVVFNGAATSRITPIGRSGPGSGCSTRPTTLPGQRTGRVSASESTPASRSSATSARPNTTVSRPSAIPRTSPLACRRSRSRARSLLATRPEPPSGAGDASSHSAACRSRASASRWPRTWSTGSTGRQLTDEACGRVHVRPRSILSTCRPKPLLGGAEHRP